MHDGVGDRAGRAMQGDGEAVAAFERDAEQRSGSGRRRSRSKWSGSPAAVPSSVTRAVRPPVAVRRASTTRPRARRAPEPSPTAMPLGGRRACAGSAPGRERSAATAGRTRRDAHRAEPPDERGLRRKLGDQRLRPSPARSPRTRIPAPRCSRRARRRPRLGRLPDPGGHDRLRRVAVEPDRRHAQAVQPERRRRRSGARPRPTRTRCQALQAPGGQQIVNGGGGAAHPAVGQGEAERAAEGLAVEAAFGVGPEAEPADDVVGVQRSPLTSALGRGRGALGRAPGQAVGDAGPEGQRAVGQAEVLLGGASRAWPRFRRPVSRSTRRRSSFAILSGRSPEGSSWQRRRLAGRRGTRSCSRRRAPGGCSTSVVGRAASGCTPAPPGWRAASSELSVRWTMPRNRRRLVRTLKIVGAMIRSRWASASRVVSRMTSLAELGVGVAQVGLDPGLPVGVAHGRGAAGDHELAGHEVVVGDGVGGEVAEVAQPEGAERVGRGQVVDLLAHVPVVAVPAQRARSASRWRSRPRCCRRGNRTDRRGAGRRRRRAAAPRFARTDSPR